MGDYGQTEDLLDALVAKDKRIRLLEAALAEIVEILGGDGHQSSDKACWSCCAMRVAEKALEDSRG